MSRFMNYQALDGVGNAVLNDSASLKSLSGLKPLSAMKLLYMLNVLTIKVVRLHHFLIPTNNQRNQFQSQDCKLTQQS
ncbi:hypothetical protein KF913_03300 [Candidatus Obscuribacterales bacterium]|nr:hypothetical protein [Candidatus Obscuribacterales bacterium]